MRHVGWRSAASGVAAAASCGVQVRNGPPDAVRMRRASSTGRRPVRHCSTALCSESTGTISPPPSRAARVTRSPAITRVSLFASATRLPARSAARVASSPAAPTIPLMTIATSGNVAASTRQAVPFPFPVSPFPPLTIPTYAGRHSAACCSSSSAFECAVRATVVNRSRCRASTCSAEHPIEPVEPRTATPILTRRRTGGTVLRSGGERNRASRGDRARHRAPESGTTSP